MTFYYSIYIIFFFILLFSILIKKILCNVIFSLLKKNIIINVTNEWLPYSFDNLVF